jgi:DNA-binding MltR family transcriptional regulator
MRSPKPSDRKSRPRVRRKKEAPKTTGSRSLKRLGRELPTIEEFNQIDRDVVTAHDRAVAILLVAQVERFLELALVSHLFMQDEDTVDLLVSRDGPLSSFYSKILLAYAMGFIALIEKDDLDRLRQIRDAFAHTVRPISFETVEIATLIDALRSSQGHSPHEPTTDDAPSLAKLIAAYITENPHRVKFVDACRKLSLQMLQAGRRR